jgi:hypothetical protein
MSPKWSNSLGYREFDKDMYEKDVLEGCEEARLHQFNLRRQGTVTYYFNVSELCFPYISFIIFHFCCYLDCHACCFLITYKLILLVFCLQCMSKNKLQIGFFIKLKQFLDYDKEI